MTLVDSPLAVAPPVEQLEAMKTIKTRKPREQKHDFKDGFGRVPARRHLNGKGWVAKTAVVEDTVYVGPNCEVFQNAYVSGKVRLEGNAKISGNATVSGRVIISQHASIFGRAVVSGEVKVRNNSRIAGNAHVTGTAEIFDTAVVTDGANVISGRISGNATISGSALIICSSVHGSNTGANIRANAVIINSTVQGRVIVQGFGQILGRSCVNNMNSRGEEVVIEDNAIVADNTFVYYAVRLRDHVVMVRCHVLGGVPNGQPTPDIRGNIVLQDRRFNSSADLVGTVERLSSTAYRTHIANFSATGPAVQIPTPAVPGFPVRQVNYLSTDNRPRRLQRLQEAGT